MYNWVLSPSKFEAAAGCPCFEEDFRENQELKDRGTRLHRCMEEGRIDMTMPQEDIDAVQYCMDEDTRLEHDAGPFAVDIREIYIRRNDRHPVAKIDRLRINTDGHVFITDYKFGVGDVKDAGNNVQIKSYVYTVFDELRELFAGRESVFEGLIKADLPIDGITGIIIQPALSLVDSAAFDFEDMAGIIEDLKGRNERVADPFKKPDPSDPDKCRKCKHAHRCPAVTTAVAEFVDRVGLLPMPDQFKPDAIVSERDRVIAQDLAGILIAWAERVKQNNRDFALANGNTIGGIYNISTRGNGFELTDTPGFVHKLLAEKLLTNPADIIPFIKISKQNLIDGLAATTDLNKDEIAEVISKAYEEFGNPKPPVTVFRRGGKKQIAKAVTLLDIPQITDPFK